MVQHNVMKVESEAFKIRVGSFVIKTFSTNMLINSASPIVRKLLLLATLARADSSATIRMACFETETQLSNNGNKRRDDKAVNRHGLRASKNGAANLNVSCAGKQRVVAGPTVNYTERVEKPRNSPTMRVASSLLR